MSLHHIDKYIDRCLIDEYKFNHKVDIDDIPHHEKMTFLDILMSNDTNVRQDVLCAMQKLIDERLARST